MNPPGPAFPTTRRWSIATAPDDARPRFTLDGSDALEARLARICAQVGRAVESRVGHEHLRGVLLGGGYGRGEGGVLQTATGDLPYNDLEFYVFTRGPALWAERRSAGSLRELGRSLSPSAGLEVEFKVMTALKLRRAAPSMFTYDLVSGHRWILGDASLLGGCEPHFDATRIPLSEAARLLMNRCSGLLFSQERLRRERFGPEEADFVGRNLAKAELALGDVFLTVHGEYHWSCRERERRLQASPGADAPAWLEAVQRHHRRGVAFKLHPHRSGESRETLAQRWSEVSALAREVWLWLEERRLGRPFADPRAYAFSPVDKCPETRAGRNRLVTARALGWREAFGDRGGRYPRERLLHALSLLLWAEPGADDRAGRRRLQEELCTRSPDFRGWVGAYERLWERFH